MGHSTDPILLSFGCLRFAGGTQHEGAAGFPQARTEQIEIGHFQSFTIL